jgi:hypothetical protein
MANETVSVQGNHPEDIQGIFDDLEANDRRASDLVHGLSDEQLNWRPDARSWSIAQCLDHLNVSNRIYLAPMLAGIEAGRRAGKTRKGPIRSGFLERLFIGNLEPPPKRKLPAPRKLVPAARKQKAEVMKEWRLAQDETRSLLHAAAGLDLNRIRFVNPLIPLIRFTVGTGFLVIAAHERRHLWQAERVKANPAFPAG